MNRTLPLLLAALMLLAPPSGATWSIILVDTSTHEVAIGSATCLTALDLKRLVPILRVENGAAAAQAVITQNAVIKKEIWDNLIAGLPPALILEEALEGDGFFDQSRQYGIAVLTPDAAGYTGPAVGAYKEHATGSSGTLTWAIQGNVLTGAPVIDAAVAAVSSTPGTMADKLMAGMLAAYAFGGDGRCSCLTGSPTSCGSPPAGGFEKSADVGFMLVARPGDPDGACNASVGCASGDYWMVLNVAYATKEDLDPVLQLEQLYASFLSSAAGHVDGLQSLAALDHDQVVGDGASTRTLQLALADIDGHPVEHGGATITLHHAPGSAGLSSLASIDDHGDGTYALHLVAGQGEGTDFLSVRIDDGFRPATIYPYPQLEHRPALLADASEVSVAAGGEVGFDLLGPDGTAGRRFALALSAAGSRPGQVLPGGAVVPLNFDRLFALSPELAAASILLGVPGQLDAVGAGQAGLVVDSVLLVPLVGLPLQAAWFTLRPADFASNAVELAVLP